MQIVETLEARLLLAAKPLAVFNVTPIVPTLVNPWGLVWDRWLRVYHTRVGIEIAVEMGPLKRPEPAPPSASTITQATTTSQRRLAAKRPRR